MPQPFRVLNVNDQEEPRTSKTALLTSAGFDVVETAGAVDALRLARSNAFDVILLGLNPLKGSGLDVCRELGSQGDGPGVDGDRACAIVLISAHATQPEDIARGMAAGADAYLVEPLADSSLTGLLHALAERHARRRAVSDECAALRARELRYRMLAATVGDAIYDWDLSTDHVEWSDAVHHMLRYQPDLVGETSQWWVDRIHAEDRTRVVTELRRILMEQQSTHEIEYRFARHDGSFAIVADRVTIIYDEGGRPLRAVGAMSDITERRLLGDQLRLAQKMEAVGLLAGGVAHDFNNVLTSILGFAGLLKQDLADSPTAFEQVTEIETSATRATALIAQLLAFSRQQVFKSEVLDLNQVITDSTRVVHRLIGPHILVEHQLASPLPTVRVDRTQFEQVLLNLIVNAGDAMPAGGHLTIRTSVVEVGRHPRESRMMPYGRYVELSVKDTGVGMDEATRARVFEPFFTTKEQGRGAGLGLATVYGIVKQSGGYIWVTSAPDAGTTFDILLPALDVQATVHEAVLPAEVAGMPAGETILIVEDEGGVRRLVQRVLTRAGYRVLEAAEGREALRLAEQFAGPIHLILTDIVLPGLSGLVVAERLKRVRPDVRILYMSGYSSETHGHDLTREGAPRLIPKPFSRDLLLHEVRRALGGPGDVSANDHE